MKKQKLIEGLEKKIIEDLKNSSNDDIIIWAYDHYDSYGWKI